MNLKRLMIALSIFAASMLPTAANDAPTAQELCDAAEPASLTTMQFERAEAALEPDIDYRAIFCTSAGAIYVDLYENLTPITVNSFVFLAGRGYYDSTTFHRVIPNFMAQGGDPTGSGRGGPGYQFEDEPVGFLTFDRPGLLAMANAGPGTNGSQFFITTAPTPHLNYKHTIFGDVLLGQDVVEAIRERDPSAASEAGETLHTVLVIDDPSAVDNSAVVNLRAATEADVVAAFDSFVRGLPPALPLDAELSGTFSTDALAAASAGDDLQDGFATFAAQHAHQYRQRMQIVNKDCDESIFFSALGIWVDAFGDAGSPPAAAQDEFMQRWLHSYGYERADSSAAYRLDAQTCDGEPGVSLLSLAARGRFLLTIEVLVAESILDRAPAASLLNSLSLQIEGALAGIFRGEIR